MSCSCQIGLVINLSEVSLLPLSSVTKDCMWPTMIYNLNHQKLTFVKNRFVSHRIGIPQINLPTQNILWNTFCLSVNPVFPCELGLSFWLTMQTLRCYSSGPQSVLTLLMRLWESCIVKTGRSFLPGTNLNQMGTTADPMILWFEDLHGARNQIKETHIGQAQMLKYWETKFRKLSPMSSFTTWIECNSTSYYWILS